MDKDERVGKDERGHYAMLVIKFRDCQTVDLDLVDLDEKCDVEIVVRDDGDRVLKCCVCIVSGAT